ncbi:MAG: hypothetical protein P1R58_12330 [bacterium]|nr:hypothetical protein [bacterium]
MKTFLYSLISMLVLSSAAMAAKVRVSLMFAHYSVGNQIITASCNDQGIHEIIDTMTVTYGTDTARILFRDYHLNYWNSGPLSDSLITCDDFRFSGFNYDLRTSSYDRTKIWNSWDGVNGQYAGFVDDFFHVPDKENQEFWKMFMSHQVPGRSGDQVTEYFDVVMIKNPYICWSFMTPAQADSIQKFYSIVRDSVAAHPEIRVGLVFGTPRLLGDTVDDSAMAKITYNLLQWFNSDNFFTHTNNGQYKNLWKFDSYSPLLEMTPGDPNRYSLKPSYSAGPGNSHLSLAGSQVAMESMLGFIRQAAQDVLVIKSGSTAASPVVSDIPDQTIDEGTSFLTIPLDDYVSDSDNSDAELSWSYSGASSLSVSIDGSRVATISPPSPTWTGTETITFIATDPGQLSGSDPAAFTVVSTTVITREDIDRLIHQFRAGQATEQEVRDLIKQYNEASK